MKIEYKDRLQQDLIKYAKQIGILDSEIPQLITDRREYLSKRAAGYGECSYELRTIFVDCSKRNYQRIEYRRSIPTNLALDGNRDKNYFYRRRRHSTLVRVYKNVKATYRDKLDVLVHELVHYRFRYMKHGEKFEQRIKEIVRGRSFQAKQLY